MAIFKSKQCTGWSKRPHLTLVHQLKKKLHTKMSEKTALKFKALEHRLKFGHILYV